MSRRTYCDVTVDIAWNLGAGPAQQGGQLIALLAAVERSGSIASAAREVGVSYRNAWGLLARGEELLGQPLVHMARGRGSTLAPLGATLVTLDARLRKALAPRLEKAREEVRRALQPESRAAAVPLMVHASHDLALAKLRDLMLERGHQVELEYRGSLESLASFDQGRCDIAGFHCPEGPLGVSIWRQYRAHLKQRRDMLLYLARRTQGLMVVRGNPKRLRSIADLASPKVRFLNRQHGAGTRLLLDLLLNQQGIDPADIRGYTTEEYTHAAVAALIAGGAADAGIGIEAAARRFNLDFIPLLHEHYYLAVRRNRNDERAVRALVAELQGEEFRQAVHMLPGYDCERAGEMLAVTDAPAKRGTARRRTRRGNAR